MANSLTISIISLVISSAIALVNIIIGIIMLKKRFETQIVVVRKNKKLFIKNIGRGSAYDIHTYFQDINENQFINFRNPLGQLGPGDEKELIIDIFEGLKQDGLPNLRRLEYNNFMLIIVKYKTEYKCQKTAYFLNTLYTCERTSKRRFKRHIKLLDKFERSQQNTFKQNTSKSQKMVKKNKT